MSNRCHDPECLLRPAEAYRATACRKPGGQDATRERRGAFEQIYY
jgi:hypothetical protein